MICPACDRTLTPLKLDDITLDVCQGGCGGIWFDNFELKKLEDDPNAQVGALDIRTNPAIHIDHQRKRKCPKCDGVWLRRHYYSPRRKVEVDSCGSCAGYWLDALELVQISQDTKAEAGRSQSVQFLQNEAEPEIRRFGQDDSNAAQRIRRVLEFLE
jgi:Zn-finger nucleic acid-binding protein